MTGSSVLLGNRVEIFPSMPAPEMNTGGGPAFAARLRGEAGSDLVAIICNSNLPARLEYLNAFRNVDHPAVMRLVESGVVAWPDGMRYYALVYQRPSAPRFTRSIDEKIPSPGTDDAFTHFFVQPMIGALSELMRTGIVHGAIRTTNIFWRPGGAPPQLGECLSTPAGTGQPVLFETIERGIAMPSGRGTGNHSDDCYAFGVTVALLAMGHNPLAGMDDQAIVQAKMERGTFTSLIGNHRLSAQQSELLRGLLTDDARQRWTATDLDQWMSGRRMTPKSTDVGRRASRHLEFAGREYAQLKPLAHAMAGNVSEAARLIEGGTLDKWLRRSVGDEDKADDVAEAIATLKESGLTAHYEEHLVTRICIALFPSAPIRYRGFSVMPNGIAALLAEAMVTGQNLPILTEIITTQLVPFWAEMQKEMKTELVPLIQQFEKLAAVVEKTNYGNGIERALYELNPMLPCMSPMLRSQYVMSPKTLLPALERVAASSTRPREPMDRHIAAYLIVRDRRNESLLESMAAPENSPRRGLAMLTLYSDMQNRYGPDNLPYLAQWLSPHLEGSVKRYFEKNLRERLQGQIKNAAEGGNLGGLIATVDDPRRLERDEQDFVAARLLYFNILKEINMLEGKLQNRAAVVQSIGRPAAAAISSLLAFITLIAVIARVVWNSL